MTAYLELTRRPVFLVAAALLWFGCSCTVVKYKDGDGNNNGNNGGPPPTLDMLVMVHIDRGTVNLAPSYETGIGALQAALYEQGVEIRRQALAPLHRRAWTGVPIIYGAGDPAAEFYSLAEALAYFASDGGALHLQEAVDGESTNLADLGSELNLRAVYHPTASDPSAGAYFTQPADGFLVVIMTHAARACGLADPKCQINDVHPADYFTRQSGGSATWLTLPGNTGLPVERIYFAFVTTEEGVDYATFYDNCAAEPNMPAGLLDVMAPSEIEYYGPLEDEIESRGGRAGSVDLCTAFSARGVIDIALLSRDIAGMVH